MLRKDDTYQEVSDQIFRVSLAKMASIMKYAARSIRAHTERGGVTVLPGEFPRYAEELGKMVSAVIPLPGARWPIPVLYAVKVLTGEVTELINGFFSSTDFILSLENRSNTIEQDQPVYEYCRMLYHIIREFTRDQDFGIKDGRPITMSLFADSQVGLGYAEKIGLNILAVEALADRIHAALSCLEEQFFPYTDEETLSLLEASLRHLDEALSDPNLTAAQILCCQDQLDQITNQIRPIQRFHSFDADYTDKPESAQVMRARLDGWMRQSQSCKKRVQQRKKVLFAQDSQVVIAEVAHSEKAVQALQTRAEHEQLVRATASDLMQMGEDICETRSMLMALSANLTRFSESLNGMSAAPKSVVALQQALRSHIDAYGQLVPQQDPQSWMSLCQALNDYKETFDVAPSFDRGVQVLSFFITDGRWDDSDSAEYFAKIAKFIGQSDYPNFADSFSRIAQMEAFQHDLLPYAHDMQNFLLEHPEKEAALFAFYAGLGWHEGRIRAYLEQLELNAREATSSNRLVKTLSETKIARSIRAQQRKKVIMVDCLQDSAFQNSEFALHLTQFGAIKKQLFQSLQSALLKALSDYVEGRIANHASDVGNKKRTLHEHHECVKNLLEQLNSIEQTMDLHSDCQRVYTQLNAVIRRTQELVQNQLWWLLRWIQWIAQKLGAMQYVPNQIHAIESAKVFETSMETIKVRLGEFVRDDSAQNELAPKDTLDHVRGEINAAINAARVSVNQHKQAGWFFGDGAEVRKEFLDLLPAVECTV